MSHRLQRLLLIIGVTLLLIYVVARIDAYVQSRKALSEFHEVSGKQAKEKGPVVDGRINFSLWSEKRRHEFETSITTAPPAAAILRIPSVDVEAPVFEGTDELTLNRGAGWIPGTTKIGASGNVAIAAHRDGFFRSLKDIKMGDTIELENHEAIEIFVVDQILTVDPSNVEVLKPRKSPTLTLITCFPFYFVGDAPQRYIVQASRIRSVEPGSGANQRSVIRPIKSIPEEEKP